MSCQNKCIIRHIPIQGKEGRPGIPGKDGKDGINGRDGRGAIGTIFFSSGPINKGTNNVVEYFLTGFGSNYESNVPQLQYEGGFSAIIPPSPNPSPRYLTSATYTLDIRSDDTVTDPTLVSLAFDLYIISSPLFDYNDQQIIPVKLNDYSTTVDVTLGTNPVTIDLRSGKYLIPNTLQQIQHGDRIFLKVYSANPLGFPSRQLYITYSGTITYDE